MNLSRDVSLLDLFNAVEYKKLFSRTYPKLGRIFEPILKSLVFNISVFHDFFSSSAIIHLLPAKAIGCSPHAHTSSPRLPTVLCRYVEI